MQIACQDQIFLVDLLALNPSKFHKTWQPILQDIFQNCQIHRFLGYDFKSDLKALKKTSELFSTLKSDINGHFLDIKLFTDCILKEEILEFQAKSGEKGLKGLTERVLGSPLDKKHQISDWTKRPLNREQKIYAALDAFVLIEIYNKILDYGDQDKTVQKALSKLEKYLLSHDNKPPKNGANFKNRITKTEDIWQESQIKINPPQLRVVCDNMLEVIFFFFFF